jgi:predicted SnoaL-like aldol condensation-catalyzing enzyme
MGLGSRGCALLVVASGWLAGCADNNLSLRAARTQQNAATVLAYLDTVYNRHEVDQAFQRYVGPVLREHSAWQGSGIESPRAALVRRMAEPTAPTRIEIEHSIAQGDLVAVQSRQLHAAGAAQVAGSSSFDLFRLAKGRIVEHWSVSEVLPVSGP